MTKEQTGLAETLDMAAEKAKCDHCAKKILAFKAVSAWILKDCAKEFSHCSVDYISEHCLSDDVEVSEHAVHQDQPSRDTKLNVNDQKVNGDVAKLDGDEQVTKLNSESTSIREGTVYYDVRFNAKVPGENGLITLIINLEIQTKDKPGYELVTRGMYYCARMISEQHGTVFTNEHYEKLQKVYSIWICPSVAKCRQNGMFCYQMVEKPIFGEPYVKEENYDLMEVVVLNLGEVNGNSKPSASHLLSTLFSAKLPLEEKKQILSENYNIAMVKEMESEVSTMCNLSDAIENRGREEGEAIGREAGRKEGVIEQAKATAIRMNKKGLSLEDIAEAIDFNIETVKKWLAPVSA